MICYASRTGTKLNLATLRAYGWRLLVSRAGEWRNEGFPRICGDNGAWADFQAGRQFDGDAYDQFLEWCSKQSASIDWLVLPDIVAGGLASLELSMRWSNRCLSVSDMVLVAVQDGMTVDDVAPVVGRKVGVFLGGSTEWKIRNMALWGEFCRQRDLNYHVARVNSAKRMAMAIAAFADSIDGSSGSRYAVTIRPLTLAANQQDLFQ